MNKKFLKHYMETNPEGTAQTYIFLVDNQDIALNIVMSGYQALCLVQEDDGYYFSADSFIEEMRAISHYGTLEEVVEHKDDIYYYPDCETMTDVAYYYIDELQALGDIPPSLQNYIDYEAYGRDLDMGGCFIETSRGMCEIPY